MSKLSILENAETVDAGGAIDCPIMDPVKDENMGKSKAETKS